MASTSSPQTGRLPAWLRTLLIALFALAVTGGVVALVIFLGKLPTDENQQFVWRRLLDEPPMLAAAVPSVFAFLALLLIVWLRREGRLQAFLVALAVITVLTVVYVPLALALRIMFSWMIVLVPMLAIALFYAGMMYIRDARSIHPVWAAFLGLLRCMVYTILSVVFLLPGCQTFEESVNYPKVAVFLDVSDSLTKVKDDTPAPGQDPKTVPTRQDKVIDFLTRNVDAKKQPQLPFITRLLQKSDIVMYRFGKLVDEKEVQRVKQGETLDRDVLAAWLNPNADRINVDKLPEDKRAAARLDLQDLIAQLRSGTNIPGSANGAIKLENNTYLQAIILISDGNNNAGSDEALIEFLTRVNNPRRNIPVYTIGVGEYRQPVEIRIEDLLAPEVARPDDKFQIRVPVIGRSLGDEEFSVTLEATRVTLDEAGKEVVRDQTFTLGPKTAKFKGAGDHPTGTVEFEVNVQDLKKIKASDPEASQLEGVWEFVAKVPRNPREAQFSGTEHVSEKAKVIVQKKELRILLFASGPTSEYKFLRSLFYREQQQKRVELSVLLQSAIVDGHLADHVDLDVDKDHALVRFPDKKGEPTPGEKQYSLSEYDTIIAIDPDWSQLSKEQLKLLKEWVDKEQGGVVFIAGPVNTHQLFRPAGMDISSLLSIYPVLPKDSRLHNLNLGEGGLTHVPNQPHVLHFSPAASKYDFLRLDEKEDSPTAGWDKFFWAGELPEPGKPPRRGFYNYYPIAKLKPDSAVVASFAGPPNTYFEDADGKRKEQPFIVAMRYGGGKTVFIGAGELWRLRVREGFHERFWIKLARYVAASTTMKKNFGEMYLPAVASVGMVSFEAKLRDQRQEPLPSDSHPTVMVRKLSEGKEEKTEKTEMKPRTSDDPKDWEGYFRADVKIREPGRYEFKIPIPGTAASLRREITIRQPNPEMDNVRNDFEYLYKIAGEAPKVLNSLTPEVRKAVQSKLKAAGGNDVPRLFFTLASADAVTDCLHQIEPQRERIKGPLFDLWDKGAFDEPTSFAVSYFHVPWVVLTLIGLLGTVVLLSLRQFLAAGIFFGCVALVTGAFVLSGLVISPSDWPHFTVDLPPIVSAYHLAWGIPLGLGVIGFAILLFMRQALYAALFLCGTWLLALAMAIAGRFFEMPDLPVNMSFVLVTVVALLSIEWLTRKLLKLA